jgi:hypothetical protein
MGPVVRAQIGLTDTAQRLVAEPLELHHRLNIGINASFCIVFQFQI